MLFALSFFAASPHVLAKCCQVPSRLEQPQTFPALIAGHIPSCFPLESPDAAGRRLSALTWRAEPFLVCGTLLLIPGWALILFPAFQRRRFELEIIGLSWNSLD